MNKTYTRNQSTVLSNRLRASSSLFR